MTEEAEKPEAAADALRDIPASGRLSIDDPGDGTITLRAAQALLVSGMKQLLPEWFARGQVEGRLRERERLAGILGHQAALRRRDRALELALTTDMTIDEAVAALEREPREFEGSER